MADHTLAPDTTWGDLTFQCETDLSSKQYYYVKLDTNEKVVLAGLNDKTLGILQNAPNGSASAPAMAVVRVLGFSKLKVAEGVAFGNFLTPTAAGKGEVCDAAGEEFGARALTSADTDDLALVELCHGEVEATDAQQ